MYMGCKNQVNCSHTCVEDACIVWGHQSGVMRSFAVTKERHTSCLGVGTLEMAGQKTYVGVHTAYRVIKGVA